MAFAVDLLFKFRKMAAFDWTLFSSAVLQPMTRKPLRVRFLVTCLDERGYLAADEDELVRLAAEHDLVDDEPPLGQAVAILQSLEPKGVGARNAIEALLLQLDPNDPDYPVVPTTPATTVTYPTP